MKTIYKLGILCFGIIAYSCVPLKQYQDLQDRNNENKGELRSLRGANEKLEVSYNELEDELGQLKKQKLQLEEDTLRLARQNFSLQNRYDDLLAQYNDVLETMTKNNGNQSSGDLLAHVQSLHEELQKREDELIKSERELAVKKQNLKEAQDNLLEMEQELQKRNKRLLELEKALSEKDSLMNALKKTVADALTGFGSDELNVHIKNGKVYVSMEEKLLFSSGSYQVSQAGVNALKKIGSVLEQKSDINVLVEGHTDDVPYKSAVLLDNWDLSVKRATSVVRILLQGTSIDETRVSAAGRGEYVPLDTSKTVEARRKNRRTEIILSPNLDQIFNILDHN